MLVVLLAIALAQKQARPSEQSEMLANRSVGPSFTNRLIHEKSPYLLQHAHNPVAWEDYLCPLPTTEIPVMLKFVAEKSAASRGSKQKWGGRDRRGPAGRTTRRAKTLNMKRGKH